MHVTFASRRMPLLGVASPSAHLAHNGHETSLAHRPALFDDRFQMRNPFLAEFFDQDDLLVERTLELSPDLLALSALTNTFQWCLRLAREVQKRRPSIKTIFGGVHPSAVPDCVMRYDEVDDVCEGEVALLGVIECLERGEDEDDVIQAFEAIKRAGIPLDTDRP